MEESEEIDINTILSDGFNKKLFETIHMLNKSAKLIKKVSKQETENTEKKKEIDKTKKELDKKLEELELLRTKINATLERLDLKYGEAKSYEEWKATQHK